MEENVGNIPLTSVEERRGRFKRNGFSAVVIDKEAKEDGASTETMPNADERTIKNTFVRWKLFKKSDLDAKNTAPPPLVHSLPHYKNGWTTMVIVGSTTYAQIVVVMCIVYLLAGVATKNMSYIYLEGFFTYLYCGSITFFLYVILYLLRTKLKKIERIRAEKTIRRTRTENAEVQANPVQLDACEKPSGRRVSIPILIRRITNMESKRPKKKVLKVSENEHSHGSFFLRIGAIVFGVGTVIYDGLEFGAFVESPADSPNSHLLLGVNPILHAILTFLQMYFIFISARLNIHKFKLIARFGLMHCLATNLCVWLRTLVRESIHEIQHHHTEDDYGNHDDHHHEDAYHGKDIKHENHTLDTNNNHPNLWDLWSDTSCMDNGAVLKPFIDDFSPYLYPFLIEFSLIAAAVLYDSWSHVGFNPKLKTDQNDEPRTVHQKVKHMRVDCQGVFKGLFFGLFSLAIGILSMILYSVLSKKKETRWMGLILVDSVHCSLLLISLIAMVICITQTRSLSFNIHHHEELGGTLLRVTALGLFTYAALSNTAAALTVSDTVTGVKPAVVLITWLLTIIEVTVQTLFMSDMTRRRVSNPEQNHEKPGRQIITFLLVSNLTLWLLYTFEVQRLDTNPVQLKFYGFKPWAMILRITFPLCIFYRFHAAITYAEIWKNTYTYRAS